MTSTSATLKGNTLIANFTDKTIKSNYNDWNFSGSVTLKLTITIVPNQPQASGESVYEWIKRHLEENLKIGLMLTGAQTFNVLFKSHQAQIVNSNLRMNKLQEDQLIAATTIILMILLAPIGA